MRNDTMQDDTINVRYGHIPPSIAIGLGKFLSNHVAVKKQIEM